MPLIKKETDRDPQSATPLIMPRLPPISFQKSIGTSSKMDKENQRQTINTLPSVVPYTDSAVVTEQQDDVPEFIKPAPNAYADDTLKRYSSQESLQNTSVTASPLLRNSDASKRRILRYGETIEQFFGWNERSTDEYKDLCTSIVKGDKSDCPDTWNRIIQLSKTETQQGAFAIANALGRRPLIYSAKYFIILHLVSSFRFRCCSITPQSHISL
jgi:hypothetical protein